METQVPKRAKLVVPMLFALATVIIATFTWISFGGSIPFAAAGYRVSADFPQASNLYPGDNVRMAGINVGQVVGVQRAGDRARVTMQLQTQFAPLHRDARAILRTKTLLGEAYIELAPGSRGSAAIPDGGAMAPRQIVAAQQLSDVLSTFNPQTRRQLRGLLRGFAAALHGRGQDLNQTLGWSAPAMANFGGLLQTLDSQRTQLGQLIGGAGQVLTAVGERQGALQAAITAGDQVFAVTAARSAGLRATVDAFPAFLTQLRGTAADAQGAVGDLNGAVNSLRPVAPLVTPALTATTTLSAQLKPLFQALPGLVADGRRGLPAGTAILQAARPTIERLLPAMEEIVPVIQLSAAVRDSIVAAFANVGSVGQGQLVQSNSPPHHFLAATTLVWNEAIGGYQKRLPTNRQNTYPAPDSENDIAHGGLKAYDCRNTGNPLIVPVIPPGTGAPPCLTQGPWTFNGLSRYFPRLQPAKP
jgi:virulence factor Mce-like protein